MIERPSIAELMRQEPPHDLAWLKYSLAAAVELELATLPPYLTALWSIDDGFGAAEAGITAVVKEEMLHMVLAGNMLRAIGGEVTLTAPSYPGVLPGGVMPHLQVPLAKLTRQLVTDTFMRIEHPEPDHPIENGFHTYTDENGNPVTYPSIGAFYDAIAAAIYQVKPGLTAERQLRGTVGGHSFEPIDTIAKMQTAILEIQEQGEGAPGSTRTDPEFGSELSHFERFTEIAEGPLPEVFDMADIPASGYPHASPHAGSLIEEFNQCYTQMLQDLQGAWADDAGAGKLGRAVQQMYGLKAPAQALMQIPLPDGSGNYGPTWEVVR